MMVQRYTFLHKINENENIFCVKLYKLLQSVSSATDFLLPKLKKMVTILLWCFTRLHNNFSVSHINLNHISFIEKQADFLLGRDSL